MNTHSQINSYYLIQYAPSTMLSKFVLALSDIHPLYSTPVDTPYSVWELLQNARK